jgi:hypothetical protein
MGWFRGESKSINIVKVVSDAMVSTVTNIINKQEISTDQSQILSVIEGEGDVVISDNKMTQSVNFNMEGVQKALTSSDVQQKLAVEIAQSAKAVTSGITFLTGDSTTKNDMQTLINTCISISTNVTQNCLANASQEQKITVEKRNGNVFLQNNTMEQIASMFNNCVQDSITNNTAIQDIVQKFSQKAVAETKGFSLWEIVAMMLVGLLFLCLPIILPLIGFVAVLAKFLFVIILLVGIVFIVLYFVDPKVSMTNFEWSKLLKKSQNCEASGGRTFTDIPTSKLAEKKCKEDKNCKAYDWNALNINEEDRNLYDEIEPPVTTFYSELGENPCKDITEVQDSLNMVRFPKVILSESKKSINSDKDIDTIRIDPITSKWYVWKIYSALGTPSTNWEEQEESEPLVADMKNKKLKIITESPVGTKGDPNVISILYKPGFLVVWTFKDKTWQNKEHNTIGLIAVVPEGVNTSGFKKEEKKIFYLIIGISLSVMGAIGTIYNFMKSRKSSAVVPKK